MKTQNYLYRLINIFELIIRLWVINCKYEKFNIKFIKDFLLKRWYKSLIFIVNDESWYPLIML